MGDHAIVVDGLWKRFRLGEPHDSLRDLLPAVGRRLFGRHTTPEQLSAKEFWALQDVSFVVDPGEALGIIGPNGAGKSTALKVLTRIMRPTRGTTRIHGRVGALIEISAGFHPDLTGLENIYLQGAIMGMRRAEIARKIDAIVDFSGAADFIDTPIKRYSSGMQARLGFSIAAQLEPDVLLIDEVLSVGDMSFQQRCVHRMQEFKKSGVAIVFISHNLQAVVDLCDRALYLHREVRAEGLPAEVIPQYVKNVGTATENSAHSAVTITSVELLDESGHVVREAISPGTALRLRVCYTPHGAFADLTFGLVVRRSTDGVVAYDGNIPDREVAIQGLEPGKSITVEYSFRAHLTRGHYYLECHVFHNPSQRFLARRSPAAAFVVTESRTFQGIADIELTAATI